LTQITHEPHRRSEEFLSTAVPGPQSGDQIKDELRRQLLLVAGFKPEEIERMNLLGWGTSRFRHSSVKG
jgi:hypothetical protein